MWVGIASEEVVNYLRRYEGILNFIRVRHFFMHNDFIY